MKWFVVLIVALMIPLSAEAHRSGCHRWHSCPSDSGSYICGDTGNCSECPDNQYCKGGKPGTGTSAGGKKEEVNSHGHRSEDRDYACFKDQKQAKSSLKGGSGEKCLTDESGMKSDLSKNK